MSRKKGKKGKRKGKRKGKTSAPENRVELAEAPVPASEVTVLKAPMPEAGLDDEVDAIDALDLAELDEALTDAVDVALALEEDRQDRIRQARMLEHKIKWMQVLAEDARRELEELEGTGIADALGEFDLNSPFPGPLRDDVSLEE